MSFLQTYLLRMVLFLVAVIVVAAFIAPQLQDAFLANWALNGLIILILLFGVGLSFVQVLGLRGEIHWLETLRRESRGGLIFPGTLSQDTPPRLLGPMVTMIGDRAGRLSLSTMSMRSLLDTIHARIEESHEISRYIIGLLIFLGLLGTFWGLLDTVNAVGQTIGGLSGGGDPVSLFEELKGGLEAPLSGMGTAFSSSLFGLAGSLVLGFLELNSGQAHNRFVNQLEEWLSSITKLGSAGATGEGEQPVSAYVHALLEKTADSLEQLQRTVARGEEDRSSVNQNLAALSDRLSSLTDHMRTEQSVMLSLAETQASLKPILIRIADAGGEEGGFDKATKGHIRNLDLRLERMSAEMAGGREQAVEELRSEIRLLTRTLAAMAEEG
ncbi:flagellar motor protein MotA [Pelagibius litoralis]|uniref:Flagellar motor protein MotA n=1 Tax=Pelagibius litoralis TaxID=374515 RepID=A0A967KAJ2_9PROT|nr:flagellar motor protein MotA [Pelagibius litoralis]NIA70512.1 flagellar motor protein MotA [Pelagibius litoralis]